MKIGQQASALHFLTKSKNLLNRCWPTLKHANMSTERSDANASDVFHTTFFIRLRLIVFECWRLLTRNDDRDTGAIVNIFFPNRTTLSVFESSVFYRFKVTTNNY